MLKKIINIVNRIIPKKKMILFNSFPDIGGNALALYSYIVNERPEIVKNFELVWCINAKDVQNARKVLENAAKSHCCKIYSKKSLRGLWIYCRSKYIITTHNYITGVKTCNDQKHFNLWHGMPFKTIGKMIENGGDADVIQADYTLATSEKFQEIMAAAFGLEKENVMVTGQPCNDLLFKKNEALKKLNIDKRKYKKIVLWMPTYRKSIIGSAREDGDSNSFGVKSVVEEHFPEITKNLKQEKLLLLIKPHPMDQICNMQIPDSSYIKIIKNEDLDQAGVILYELLSESDVLLTDYSSVFIDYLNMERPVAFICDDIELYADNRGFFFKPVREYLPGELIRNYEEFEIYLRNLDEINEKWEKQRKNINQLFNQYSDGNSSKRVCDFIFKDEH